MRSLSGVGTCKLLMSQVKTARCLSNKRLHTSQASAPSVKARSTPIDNYLWCNLLNINAFNKIIFGRRR